jgi:hypothetical protein
MPSPEEEEVEAGEVRRLLMPAMPVGRAETEKKATLEGGGSGGGGGGGVGVGA